MITPVRRGFGTLSPSIWATALIVLPFLLNVSGCATVPSDRRENTVAVWDLDNLTPSESVPPDLGELLSARVIETIRKEKDYTVVERERLLLALEELHLGTTAVVDQSTQLRLGRLVGAQSMVFGGYQVMAGRMRVDLRLVEVETGRILKTAHRVTQRMDVASWLAAVEEATREML